MKDQTLQIRDKVLRPGFTQIPNQVLRDGRLAPGDKILYALLLSYAWQQSFCYPGQKRLADDMNCDSRTIRRHLAALEEVGLVSEMRRGLSKTNVYVLEPLHLAYPEADRTELSAQEGTILSAPDGSPVSDKEYSVEEDTIKKTQGLSRNPKIAEMQKFLGFPEPNAPYRLHCRTDPIPNPAKEAGFVKKMLSRGFSWDEIFGLWKDKVIYRGGEFVSMQWVNEDIGKGERHRKDRGDTEAAGAERLVASVGKPLR